MLLFEDKQWERWGQNQRCKGHVIYFVGAYCQNTLHSPDKTFTHIKNMVLITTDLMHHGTFSTCICCGGYRERRQRSPQLCVLLPKSFRSSCPPFCYTAQRICYLNNFSPTVEKGRNIYIHICKTKKVCQPEVNPNHFKIICAPFRSLLHSCPAL